MTVQFVSARLILLVAVVFCFQAITPLRAHGQDAQVSASISDSTIGTEEALVYTITIEGSSGGSIQTPRAPEGDGLQLLQQSPSTQSSMSIINGAVSQRYSLSWTYRPEREGTVKLGSTTVQIGDKAYKTNEIDIQVVPQSQRPARSARQAQRRLDPFSTLFDSPVQEPEPAAPVVRDTDIFIRAVPSSRSVVQNEQVIIEYQLFFREGIQLRQSRLTDSWDAEGFWREELDVETRPIPEIVIENGLRYNKIILKRAAVFPTRAGTLFVDSLRIESEALVPSSSRDPFQQLFSMRSRFEPVKLGSRSIEIESLPIPGPIPPSFTGAVGSYTFKTGLDRTTMEVGESIQFKVTITGAGNLATLDAPRFTPPAAFELYEPQISLNVNRSGRQLRGSKTFTYVLVPRTNGIFELPAVEFTSYDPRTKTFETSGSDPVTVTVTGSASTPASISATTNGLPVDDVAPPFARAGDWEPANPVSFHRMTWPYMALFLPILLIGVAFIVQRHQNKLAGDPSYARNRRAHPLAKKHLKQAQTLMDGGDTVKFFAELERAVLGFVGNRLNVSERGLTRERLNESLRSALVPAELCDRLMELLDICDQGRFAPVGIGEKDRQRAYENAAGLIVALGTTLPGKQ